MSGGEWDCNQYYLQDIGERIKPINPPLGKMLQDLYEVLNEYDYELSGDSGKRAGAVAWAKFTNKWFKQDYTTLVKTELLEKCREYIDELVQDKR